MEDQLNNVAQIAQSKISTTCNMFPSILSMKSKLSRLPKEVHHSKLQYFFISIFITAFKCNIPQKWNVKISHYSNKDGPHGCQRPHLKLLFFNKPNTVLSHQTRKVSRRIMEICSWKALWKRTRQPFTWWDVYTNLCQNIQRHKDEAHSMWVCIAYTIHDYRCNDS